MVKKSLRKKGFHGGYELEISKFKRMVPSGSLRMDLMLV